NLFSPSKAPADAALVDAYVDLITPIAEELGVELGEPRFTDDAYAEKLALVLYDLERHRRDVVVSFVFGCPPADVIEHLQSLGAWVWITVTQVDEALEAAAAGADAVIAQGSEAGGHRGAWVDDDRPQVPTLELTAAIRSALDDAGHTGRGDAGDPLPIVAAGGLMTGEHIAQALGAGATAASSARRSCSRPRRARARRGGARSRATVRRPSPARSRAVAPAGS
ncbi:MAG: nitronate monooxygenase, partial [Solirubrobacteraceae bacterium]